MTRPVAPVGDAGTAGPGFVVAGRYRLERRIAGGGMGDVWRARDETLDRPVAIKLLHPAYRDEPAFLERFRGEARLAGMLSHPGIAAVHDYGEGGGPGGSAWLVMELVEGEALSTLLHRRGALPPDQALDVVGQAALALQAAHDAGVVHRDVKPGNLLVRPDGVIKVTDFGIARATGAAPLTRTGTVLGTAHYLSPEQARGLPATPASDVYALGVVAYECLTGHRPFAGDSPVEVALAHQRDQVPPLPGGLPAPVADLVTRALAKDPADRFGSAGALGRTALGIRTALYGAGGAGTAPLAGQAAVPSAVSGPGATRELTAATRAVPAGGAGAPTRVAATASQDTAVEAAPGALPGARPRRRRRLRLPLLVLAGLLLLAVIGAVRGCAGTHHPAPPPPAPPPTSTAPAGIHLDPAAYRGRPAGQVLAELSALGLVPTRQDVAQDGAPGTVVTVVTSGGDPLPATLAPGAAVVVQVVAAPPPPATPTGKGRGTKGKGG